MGFMVMSILSGEIKIKDSNLKFIISGLDKYRSKGLMRLNLSGEIEQDELQPWIEGFVSGVGYNEFSGINRTRSKRVQKSIYLQRFKPELRVFLTSNI